MKSLSSALTALSVVLTLVFSSSELVAQQGNVPPGQDPRGAAGGLSREEMWYAPTKEDWAKPCLITWQRSYEDALAVSKATGKPMLVCVNMDGEIASEHYAGIRYRQPEIAALYDPYVCVIASVYRHTPRDYDENGERILCPRFGSVTCGEHIAIEPGLFDQFFEGERVAPRHIAVELDEAEIYDVYYAFDTDTIFNSLEEGVKGRPDPRPLDRDRPIVDRVASPDVEDRIAVEMAYRTGDKVLKRSILKAAVKYKDIGQVELLRLALFGSDAELSSIAWNAINQSTSTDAINLINEALRYPMAEEERVALIETLERIGENSYKAKMLAGVHKGLGAKSSTIDIDAWRRALGEPISPTVDELGSQLQARSAAAADAPQDAEAQLALAEAFLACAVHPETSFEYERLMFEDARRAVKVAEELGAEGPRVDTVFALAANHFGEWRVARARAQGAVKGIPPQAHGKAGCDLLDLFISGRQPRLARAANLKTEWPKEWLTDVNTAYDILSDHDFGTAALAVNHYDLLKALGAPGDANGVLDRGLARFQDSWDLHDRLRARLLKEKKLDGLDGLEAVYDRMLAAEDAHPDLEWFAGYASIVAAEFHRRAGNDSQANSAYDRAIAHYDSLAAKNPETQETADHYVAMAIAGKARIALEREKYQVALDGILASFERREAAAASLDGLNLSAGATAKTLLARLQEDPQLAEMATRLETAIDGLDPVLLRPAAFEGQGGPSPDARRMGGMRGRRGR